MQQLQLRQAVRSNLIQAVHINNRGFGVCKQRVIVFGITLLAHDQKGLSVRTEVILIHGEG